MHVRILQVPYRGYRKVDSTMCHQGARLLNQEKANDYR